MKFAYLLVFCATGMLGVTQSINDEYDEEHLFEERPEFDDRDDEVLQEWQTPYTSELEREDGTHDLEMLPEDESKYETGDYILRRLELDENASENEEAKDGGVFGHVESVPNHREMWEKESGISHGKDSDNRYSELMPKTSIQNEREVNRVELNPNNTSKDDGKLKDVGYKAWDDSKSEAGMEFINEGSSLDSDDDEYDEEFRMPDDVVLEVDEDDAMDLSEPYGVNGMEDGIPDDQRDPGFIPRLWRRRRRVIVKRASRKRSWGSRRRSKVNSKISIAGRSASRRPWTGGRRRNKIKRTSIGHRRTSRRQTRGSRRRSKVNSKINIGGRRRSWGRPHGGQPRYIKGYVDRRRSNIRRRLFPSKWRGTIGG